jgi:hypothetical protein
VRKLPAHKTEFGLARSMIVNDSQTADACRTPTAPPSAPKCYCDRPAPCAHDRSALCRIAGISRDRNRTIETASRGSRAGARVATRKLGKLYRPSLTPDPWELIQD